MVDLAATSSRRWPFSAAATFVGLMWIAYGWSIWAAQGIDSRSGGMWIGSLTTPGYYIAGALFPGLVTHEREWERLVASIFLHGGFLHILMNSVAILQLGRILEAFTTRGRSWFTLLFSGICGSLVTWLWAEVTDNTKSFTIGASGAGCGLGAALIVFSRGIAQLSEFRKQMTTWVVVMLAMGLMPMISGTGHAGGAVGGALAGFIIRRRGSVRLATDRYSRGIDALTVMLTLAFAAALAVNAARVPERRAEVTSALEIQAAARDVERWVSEGVPADLADWIERVSSLEMSGDSAEERRALLEIVRPLRARAGQQMSPEEAVRVRTDLQRLRGG